MKHLEPVLRELARNGIDRPEIEHTSKHVRVSWTGDDGQPQCVVTAKTPSDNRSIMNSRAEVRRLLRKAKKITSYSNEGIIGIETRVRRLENDFEALLNLVSEKLEAPQPVTDEWFFKGKLREGVPIKPKKKVVAAPKKRMDERRRLRPRWILRYLRYDEWRQLGDIAKEAMAKGRSYNAVAVALHFAKKDGLADLDPLGRGWRKNVSAEKRPT